MWLGFSAMPIKKKYGLSKKCEDFEKKMSFAASLRQKTCTPVSSDNPKPPAVPLVDTRLVHTDHRNRFKRTSSTLSILRSQNEINHLKSLVREAESTVFTIFTVLEIMSKAS